MTDMTDKTDMTDMTDEADETDEDKNYIARIQNLGAITNEE